MRSRPPVFHTFAAGAIGFCTGAGVGITVGLIPGAAFGLAIVVGVVCASFSDGPSY